MKGFLYGHLLGFISAGILFFYLKPEPLPIEDIKIEQISGEKIAHKNVEYSSGAISFITESEGKGVISTEIPTDRIPEVQSWNNNIHTLQIEFLLTDKRNYGLSYMRRWNNFAIGGGVLLSDEKFEGVKLQAQYWFKI